MQRADAMHAPRTILPVSAAGAVALAVLGCADLLGMEASYRDACVFRADCVDAAAAAVAFDAGDPPPAASDAAIDAPASPSPDSASPSPPVKLDAGGSGGEAGALDTFVCGGPGATPVRCGVGVETCCTVSGTAYSCVPAGTCQGTSIECASEYDCPGVQLCCASGPSHFCADVCSSPADTMCDPSRDDCERIYGGGANPYRCLAIGNGSPYYQCE